MLFPDVKITPSSEESSKHQIVESRTNHNDENGQHGEESTSHKNNDSIKNSYKSILETGQVHKQLSWIKKLRKRFNELIVGKNIGAEKFVEGQILVERQTKFHENKSNLFGIMLEEKLSDKLKRKCEESEGIIALRDPVGACIFHIAYLYGIYEVGRWLVKKYPLACLEPYGIPDDDDDLNPNYLPYTGENILHIAIMQRQLDETEFVLKTYSDWNDGNYLSVLLSAKTTGHFFQPGGEVGKYFGELPLLFAVCSNGIDMVDLILKYSPHDALFKAVDTHGNNAFHMCVLHNLPDMYDHIIELIKKRDPSNAAAMSNAINKDGHSPLTLAAVTGSPMFQFILQKGKTKLWSYGPVTRYLIDLDGIDMPHNATMNIAETESSPQLLNKVNSFLHGYNPIKRLNVKEKCGAIEYMCIADRSDMLISIPEIRLLIDTKWDRIGFPQFKIRFLFYVLVTIMLSLIVCLYQFQTGNGFLPWFTWCLFVVLFIIMTYKFICELPDMLDQGLAYWGISTHYDQGTRVAVRGAAQLDNICSSVEFFCFSIACLLKVLQYFGAVSVHATDGATKILLSITVVTAWIYLYFFLLGFRLTGVFVVIVIDILGTDMPTFLSLFGVVLFGFGSAFALLNSEMTGSVGYGFQNIINSIWTLLIYTITGGNEGIKFFPYGHGSSPRWFYVGLVMLYNLCIVFLMLNLLIAMMNKKYSDLLEKSKSILYREKYNIMCSFERGYTANQLARNRQQYGTMKKEDGRLKFYFQMEEVDDTWIVTGNLSTNKSIKPSIKEGSIKAVI